MANAADRSLDGSLIAHVHCHLAAHEPVGTRTRPGAPIASHHLCLHLLDLLSRDFREGGQRTDHPAKLPEDSVEGKALRIAVMLRKTPCERDKHQLALIGPQANPQEGLADRKGQLQIPMAIGHRDDVHIGGNFRWPIAELIRFGQKRCCTFEMLSHDPSSLATPNSIKASSPSFSRAISFAFKG